MDSPILEPSLYTVKAVLILDNDGDRLYAKYYDDTYPTVKEQKAFEKNIFNKTHRTDSEIALLEGLTVVYKSNIDLFFYVIGSSHENELMLMAVLNCLFDSLSQMLRKNVEKRALLENMEGLFLAVDEIVDGGVILESDPQQVVHRVALRGDDVPLTEQTVTQNSPLKACFIGGVVEANQRCSSVDVLGLRYSGADPSSSSKHLDSEWAWLDSGLSHLWTLTGRL
uniref:Coatomer subunit zeta n=2 Tax=Oryzias melastigma TaxID=30732 RepID=A0A3B3C9W1_ORYME